MCTGYIDNIIQGRNTDEIGCATLWNSSCLVKYSVILVSISHKGQHNPRDRRKYISTFLKWLFHNCTHASKGRNMTKQSKRPKPPKQQRQRPSINLTAPASGGTGPTGRHIRCRWPRVLHPFPIVGGLTTKNTRCVYELRIPCCECGAW